MILGMSTETFTLLHTIISLIGIVSGLVALSGLLTGKRLPGWTLLFLVSTVLTSVTGFPLSPFGFDPPRAIGTISLVVLAVALFALYGKRLAGPWRWIYIATALTAFYFNVFVGVVMAFRRIPVLQPLAPTQSEPPFIATELIVLALFVIVGIVAAVRFHPESRAQA